MTAPWRRGKRRRFTEGVMGAMSSPVGQELGAALLEDEGNFVDHAKSSSFLVREHEF